jgi:hypothetical protein
MINKIAGSRRRKVTVVTAPVSNGGETSGVKSSIAAE